MLLCSHSSQDLLTLQTFGTAFNLECDITLSQVYEFTEPLIYEMYIVDVSGNYYDIPVAIYGYEHDGSLNYLLIG